MNRLGFLSSTAATAAITLVPTVPATAFSMSNHEIIDILNNHVTKPNIPGIKWGQWYLVNFYYHDEDYDEHICNFALKATLDNKYIDKIYIQPKLLNLSLRKLSKHESLEIIYKLANYRINHLVNSLQACKMYYETPSIQ